MLLHRIHDARYLSLAGDTILSIQELQDTKDKRSEKKKKKKKKKPQKKKNKEESKKKEIPQLEREKQGADSSTHRAKKAKRRGEKRGS